MSADFIPGEGGNPGGDNPGRGGETEIWTRDEVWRPLLDETTNPWFTTGNTKFLNELSGNRVLLLGLWTVEKIGNKAKGALKWAARN